MAIPKKVINFLEKGKVLPAGLPAGRQGRQVKYEIIKHRTVYTAFDKAKTLKRGPLAGGWRVGRSPEKMVGKTLVLKTDGKLAMVLIPANKNLDKEKIKKLLKAKKVELVSERLIKNKFKGVKVGAIPPFGNLWGLRTFIDNSLMREKEIILNGGDYNFSIKLKSKEIKKLVPDSIFGNFGKKK